MEEDNNNKGLSRKKFLRITGSIAAGGMIAGVSGKLIRDMIIQPEKVFYDADGDIYDISDGDTSVSPYRKKVAVRTPGDIDAFDVLPTDKMVAASGGFLSVYSPEGTLEQCFEVGQDVRDISIAGEEIYVLFPSRIAVWSPSGEILRGWDACSDNSDYCSLTVSSDGVFVTDVFAKNLCQYSHEGDLIRFIDSPNGFVVPSYSFGIASHGNTIYCSNPGRHLVESYSGDGKYLASFGHAGVGTGYFSGCCNPVHLFVSQAGEIITSEKGIPRICCYSTEGVFRSVLLNRKALGGGYDAYEARIASDGRILVAGKRSLSVYSFDPSLARAEGGSQACEICAVSNCPVKRGVTV